MMYVPVKNKIIKPTQLTTITTTAFTTQEKTFKTQISAEDIQKLTAPFTDMNLLQHLQQKLDAREANGIATNQTQKRLLPFLAMPTATRFSLMRDSWAPRTRATYWAILTSLATILELPSHPDDKVIQKSLDAEARSAPNWSMGPENFLTPATAAEIQKIASTQDTPLLRAIFVSFILGQRLGDTLKWRRANIWTQTFPYCPEEILTITITEGKTVESTHPYSLHCPLKSAVAQEILAATAQTATSSYIFWTSDFILDKKALALMTTKLEKQIHHILAMHNLDFDLRGVRRGGLSLMAMSGWSYATIRLFSRHTSDTTLSLYLLRGSLSAANAEAMSEVVRYQEIAQH